MKATNVGILLVIVLVVLYVMHYRSNRKDIGFAMENDTSYVDSRDTIPVGKRYEKKHTIKWEEEGLGGTQDVSHQVPTDYRSNSNNWDEDLRHIGR